VIERLRRAGEAGFTLIELLVATSLSLIVVIGSLTFIVVEIDQQNGTSSRSAAALQGEAGLQRLVRDLRGAMEQTTSGTPLTAVASTTATTAQLVFSIPTSGATTTPQTVTWVCTVGGSCTRQLGNGTAVTEIRGVTAVTLAPFDSSGAALALPATNPAFINVSVSLQVTSQLQRQGQATQAVRGESNPIVVQTGIDLRNFA